LQAIPRTPLQIAAVAAVVGAIALVLAAITGPPYLGSGGVNGWLIGFAVALFAFLLAIPFAVERLLRDTHPNAEARWDRAVPAWGGIALLVTVLGVAVGIAGDFAGDSLAGSAGLMLIGAGGLVLVAVLFMLLAG
jgi:hypothetical protein